MKVPAMKKLEAPKPAKKNNSKNTVMPSEYDERPNFSFYQSQLPAISKWNLQDEYHLIIKVKMIGARLEDYGSKKGEMRGEFKVLAVGVDKDNDSDD